MSGCLFVSFLSPIIGPWAVWTGDSDPEIIIFSTNRNRNRFAEPTSVQIGIGIFCEFQNLRIGRGIIFVRLEVFANYSQIPDKICS